MALFVLVLSAPATVAFAQAPPSLSDAETAAIAGEVNGDIAKRNLEGVVRFHRQRGSRGYRSAADLVVDRVLQQVPEVRADRRLAAADVHVEHLHPLQLVDHRLALLGRELPRVTPTRGRQAVRALEVACVGQLPRQADGRVQAGLEVLDQLHAAAS